MTHPLTRRAYQGLFVSLLAVMTCAAIQPLDAAQSVRPASRPKPIEAALNLLRWPPNQIPAIVVIAERPETVSPLAEGWVVRNSDGSERPTIYIAGWSALYRAALADPRGAHHDIIRLAGVLAHERVHIRQGPDEEQAYAKQLITLESLHATLLEIANVRRALALAGRQHRATQSPEVSASSVP
jgi:hypothetical protein